MHLQKVKVEGFRLLQDAEISFESESTVVVGRNNSGKTSLTDVFDRFMGVGSQKFRIEDFSAGIRGGFFNAKKLRTDKASPEDVLAALPVIALTLTFQYESDIPDLGPLAPFVIDLDATSTTAIIRIEYSASVATLGTLLDMPTAPAGVKEEVHFLRELRERLPRAYATHISAIDPADTSNTRDFDGVSHLSKLIQCDFVRAQRELDHPKNGDPSVIGRLLGNLFKTASASTAPDADKELAAKLKGSVEGIERSVQADFDEMLKELLPALQELGFPGLNDTNLQPETSLNVEALLSDHTKVVYAGADGVHLPEGYNGLGTRNLIYMLLQLEGHHKAFRARPVRPATHLIFIEEPEAHLHPQMQEVFVSQLNAAIGKLSARYPGGAEWKVQFVITTHSPHIANAASFEAVRYFLNERNPTDDLRRTKIKDFKKGMASVPPDDKEFLHQYMTLTKCDLYFADKAILVEGTTERILMPRLCQIVDASLEEGKRLAKQYISCVEVGGAYAQKFYPLLDFLELKTLIITDIDAVKGVVKAVKGGQKTVYEKCLVSEGERTSNQALKEWFREKVGGEEAAKKMSPADLLAMSDADKVAGVRRIAYQTPEVEGAPVCARSYEDALVLANPDLFELNADDDLAEGAWDIAKDLAKAETALRFALYEKNWVVPRYIQEGLVWLSEDVTSPMAAKIDEVANQGAAEAVPA